MAKELRATFTEFNQRTSHFIERATSFEDRCCTAVENCDKRTSIALAVNLILKLHPEKTRDQVFEQMLKDAESVGYDDSDKIITYVRTNPARYAHDRPGQYRKK